MHFNLHIIIKAYIKRNLSCSSQYLQQRWCCYLRAIISMHVERNRQISSNKVIISLKVPLYDILVLEIFSPNGMKFYHKKLKNLT